MKIDQITENMSHTSKRLHDIEKEKGVKPGTPEWFKLWFSLPYLKESTVVEGYKLQLERDTDMMVLNIVDTATGKRTEVRGKAGYETNGYDKNDKLHQLLDKISKTANISELMNGEPVGINPKHPDGASAKKATTKAFNEAKDGLPVKTLKGLYHVGTMDSSEKRDGFEGAGLSVSTHPDAWKQIARGHVTGDTHSATKEGNKFLDVHSLSDAHNKQIKQWAIENGYLEQQETVTVCYYDDEMEDDLCSTFDSMADAEAEYDEELKHMDVTVDKGGIVPTDKLKKETRQNRIDSTGVLEFVLPIFAEQQGLDGVWWQDNLDVQRYSAPRGVIVPSKIKSWKFTVNESITEAFDNPYSYYWDDTYNGDDSFLAKAEMDMGELMVMFSVGEPGESWTIDFAVDGSMDKTGDGDQFRIFATVVAVIKDWMANKVDLSKVTQIDFSSDKDGEAEDSRAKLYKRFGQQLASKLGWNLEVTDRGQFASFKIKNPNAPVKEAVNEAIEMKISDLTISDAGMAIAQSVGGGSRTDAPLAVTKLPSGHVYLVNGYHRLVDAMQAGKDTVSVEYVPYEKVEILWKQEREQDIKYGKQFNENFADGKVKGKSRPGRVKKSGASCNGSVTELRAKAKKASGEKAKMYHWCANMKAGKKK